MKYTIDLALIGATVRGIDLRDDTVFEDFCVINEPTYNALDSSLRTYITGQYGFRGFDVKEIILAEPVRTKLDLQALYMELRDKAGADNAGAGTLRTASPTEDTGATGEPPQAPDEPPSASTGQLPQGGAQKEPEVTGNTTPPAEGGHPSTEGNQPKKTRKAPSKHVWEKPPEEASTPAGQDKPRPKKGTSARLYDYLRQHSGPGVIKAIADATMAKLSEDDVRDMVNGKALSGHRWSIIAAALDILEKNPVEPSQIKKTESAEGGLGEIDEAKLRRRTQAALKLWVSKHGLNNIKKLVRATRYRVTEETIKEMVENSDAGRLAHVQAIDRVLRMLALAEAGKESDSRGYDMT